MLLAVATVAAGQETVLTGPEIVQALRGNTGEIPSPQGAVTTYVYYGEDGTSRMIGPRGRDGGFWWVDSNGDFCSRWLGRRAGAVSCNPIVRIGNGDRYRWGDVVFRVLKGNPRDL